MTSIENLTLHLNNLWRNYKLFIIYCCCVFTKTKIIITDYSYFFSIIDCAFLFQRLISIWPEMSSDNVPLTFSSAVIPLLSGTYSRCSIIWDIPYDLRIIYHLQVKYLSQLRNTKKNLKIFWKISMHKSPMYYLRNLYYRILGGGLTLAICGNNRWSLFVHN